MKAFLLFVVVALGGLLALQWVGWPPETPGADTAPSAGDPVLAAGEAANPLDLLQPLADREEYAVVVERPLFTADRRPPPDVPEEAAPEPAADLSLDKVDLNAVLITPQESLAWVRDASSQEVRRVRPGEEVEGWAVRDILPDRVVLERQGDTNTLILRDYANMPPAAPRPQAPTPSRPQPQSKAQPQPKASPGAQPPPRVPTALQRPSPDNRNPRSKPNVERQRPPPQE